MGEVLSSGEILREAVLRSTVTRELLIFGTELVIDLMALLRLQGWARSRSLLLSLPVLRFPTGLLNPSINRFIKRFINFFGDARRVESTCLSPIQCRYVGFLWMCLSILRATILMIGLYLWAHRSIVFVIESLLQAVEVSILSSHWRNLRSILLMTRSLDDRISSRICNTILCSLLLRALTQSRPCGEVLNLYHLLLLILLCVVLVILRHRLMGAQIL